MATASLTLCLVAGLAACHPAAQAARDVADRVADAGRTAPASLYRLPPAAVAAAPVSAATLRLTGVAEPGARVRLASPDGRQTFAQAGRDGAWSLDLAAAAAPRLFGLAMLDGARAIQSEGYLAILPRGPAAQLRAGAGALVLVAPTVTPIIQAVDFDAKGGAVVSGHASPHAAVEVWVDGARRGRGQSAPDGQFSLALNEPLSLAAHRIEAVDGPRRAQAMVRLDPPARFSDVPYRAARDGQGWRIDWITPGGGMQTTLLITPDGTNA